MILTLIILTSKNLCRKSTDLTFNGTTRTSHNQTGLRNFQRIEEPNGKSIISWVFQSVGKIFAFFAKNQL
jgi:hypothetical protein